MKTRTNIKPLAVDEFTRNSVERIKVVMSEHGIGNNVFFMGPDHPRFAPTMELCNPESRPCLYFKGDKEEFGVGVLGGPPPHEWACAQVTLADVLAKEDGYYLNRPLGQIVATNNAIAGYAIFDDDDDAVDGSGYGLDLAVVAAVVPAGAEVDMSTSPELPARVRLGGVVIAAIMPVWF